MWQKHFTSYIIAIFFILLLTTFWFLPTFAFVVFLSILLDLLLIKPVTELRLHTHISQGLSATIVLCCFLIAVGGIISIVSNSVIPSLERFINDLPEITARIQELPMIARSSLLTKEVDHLWADIANVGVDAVKSSLTILLSVFSKFIDILITLFITFYLLADGTQIKRWIARLFPDEDYGRIMKLFNRILQSLKIYISSQLTVCIITSLIVFAYFYLRHLPYAPVFAVLSGISEFIPVVGPTIASFFGIIMTATISPLIAIHTAFFYLFLTQINHNLIYPFIVGKGLSLHAAAVILAIFLGGELMGPPGMFLAVPCVVILRDVIVNIYNDVKKKRTLPTA